MSKACVWVGVALLVQVLFSSPGFAGNPPAQLFMDDGQLKSHLIRVFLTQDISEEAEPKLRFSASHSLSRKQPGEDQFVPAVAVARNQHLERIVDGKDVGPTGTLLLFDLSNYPMPFYKGMMRFTPILTWNEQEGGDPVQHLALGAREVNIGNPVAALVWTSVLVVCLVLLLAALCRKSGQRAIGILCDEAAHLSLSRTQVAAWTVAIGGVVAGFGMIRLEVPAIPESLVALMGLSLATGAISYAKSPPAAVDQVAPPPSAGTGRRPQLSDLVREFSISPEGQLSLPRAQMVFWTILTLALFLVKSILAGALWEVPWELVALMGLSQASYLTPKLLKSGKS